MKLNNRPMMLKKRKHRRPKNIYPPDPDSAVIALMMKYKADVSKTRPIHFYLYFPAKSDAQKAKSELILNGYSVDIDASSTDSQWLCLATTNLRPNILVLSQQRQYFEILVKKFNGNFDGWETEMLF